MIINLPYASKVFGDKKLFARNHGVKQVLVQGENTIEFSAIYDWAKFTAIEVIGAEIGDTADLKVYTSSGIMLNQFGFTVNLAKDFYRRDSKFDADFVAGLKIVITYNSISAKTVGINYIMDELK